MKHSGESSSCRPSRGSKPAAKGKKRIRPELAMIILLLVLSLGALAVMYLGRSHGSFVVVSINGVETQRISLSADGVYELNGGSNVLVIADGCARMQQASCPDQVCVRQGSVAYRGQCITCLPNRLIVTVEGEANVASGVQVDVISS